MDPKQKLIDLAAKRKDLLDKATKALEDKDRSTYESLMKQVSDLNTEMDDLQALVSELQREVASQSPAAPQSPAHDNVEDLRASNEYVRVFCQAVRARMSPTIAQQAGGYEVLLDALTEGVDENGGFLVPVDLQTRINELRRQMVCLRDLVTVEPVTTLKGYRVIDKNPTSGFTKVAEMGEIPTDDEPSFTRLDYSCEDYGLIVPISNDLLADNDAGLMAYLARWMAKKSVLTENKLILDVLAPLAPTAVAAGNEIAAIKHVLNVELDPDIALSASILANQTAYDALDQLVDTTGRPLLQPDLTAGTGYRIKQKPIKCVADRLMPSVEGGSPVYIGDFAAAMTLFDRQVMELTTTNIGGKAWRTNSTEARAIMRLDLRQMDSEAVKRLNLSGGAAVASDVTPAKAAGTKAAGAKAAGAKAAGTKA